ncbi:type II CRISPR RNA-guided endonuclease Cas9 [Acetobacterium sp.]|uniref:type II CRISPR RNA-guided endonuclease Cas9 n=1 Tax=Acetobacterium sp. TaxID=1872094 RepID=UPI003593CEB3
MYKIGLDIGTTSVGFAVLETDINNEPKRIIDLGCRIFDCAEVPKTGASLATTRRLARGSRRRNRRHKHRLERIKNLMIRNQLLTKECLECLYDSKNLPDIYQVRYEALDNKLSNEDFARLLIHLAQRRGFKSNRKVDSEDTENKEAGKLLKAVSDNRNRMAENGYRTIGEMIFLDEKFSEHKRNKSEDYSHTIDRSQMVEEIEYIFKSQRALNNAYALETFEQEYLKIYTSQRSFEEGPGEQSPYAGNQIEKMIGRCTFEKDEPRAVKGAYTYEYSVLLQKINGMTIKNQLGEKRRLNDDERMRLDALAHEVDTLKYIRIRKVLDLCDDEYFVGLSYGRKEIKEVEDKTKFQFLKHYHLMKKTFNKISKDKIIGIPLPTRDEIARILTLYKTDEKITEQLKQMTDPIVDAFLIEAVLTLPAFKQVGNLSLKATQRILPYLKEGQLYSDACTAAGYDFRAHAGHSKKSLLPPLEHQNPEITSPVVKRSISQTIKVVNAIVKKYGVPMSVNIELAREMSKNHEDRKAIEKEQKENFEKNDKIKKRLKDEFSIHFPTNQDVVKLKLWEEQDGICLYSGEKMQIQNLFNTGYAEIDHIIPYSISFDDRFINKVLVMAKENQDKKNRLPLQYLTGEKREQFIILANTQIRNHRKRENLLKETITPDEMDEWKDRSLTDTRYITKFMYNYLNDYMLFDDIFKGKKKVRAVNGAVTAYMRKRWQLSKVRADGDLHHALDAVVVACITDGNIQKVTRFSKNHELRYERDHDRSQFHEKFPPPWVGFSDEVGIRLSENPVEQLEKRELQNYEGVDLSKIKAPFVSRYKQKKMTGKAHEDTVKSRKVIDGQQYAIKKVQLTTLKLDNNGEIKDYYEPESDRFLYELLKNRLKDVKNDAKKAFAEPVFKPTPKGGKAPEVKKVKIIEKMNIGVAVHNDNGIASNDSMVRVDVYQIENDGYYLVPIYVADLLKERLPNKAIVAHKPYEDWREMKPADFIFSLYPNDLIYISFTRPKEFTVVNSNSTLAEKKKVEKTFVYYKKAHSANGTISVITHDNTYTLESLGVKTLASIEKYGVDVLGNIQKVERERRPV